MPPKKGAKGKKPAQSSVTTAMLNNAVQDKEKDRSCTGVLASHRDSRDIKIEQVSLSAHSKILLNETEIELNFGNSSHLRTLVSSTLPRLSYNQLLHRKQLF